MGMDQYLLIPFLGGWTSIYQLFWCSPGVQGFDTLPYQSFLNFHSNTQPAWHQGGIECIHWKNLKPTAPAGSSPRLKPMTTSALALRESKCIPSACFLQQCTSVLGGKWQITSLMFFLVRWTVLSFCFKCWNPTKTNAYHILSWCSVLKCHWKYNIIILYHCHVIGKVVLISSFYCQCLSYPIHDWLVVSTPLKSISQLGSLFPIYGKSKKSCSKPPTRSPSYSHCCWFIAYNHY